jgi:hypothetical protein
MRLAAAGQPPDLACGVVTDRRAKDRLRERQQRLSGRLDEAADDGTAFLEAVLGVSVAEIPPASGLTTARAQGPTPPSRESPG